MRHTAATRLEDGVSLPGSAPGSCQPGKTGRQRSGFTLIELLVVITIIAILASMTMVATKLVMSSARKLTCQANLRQLGLASMGYANDWEGRIPALKDGTGFWFDKLQPFLEDQNARAGTLSGVRTVQWGCRMWKGNYAGGWGQSNIETGYGMNTWLNLPADDSTCDISNTLGMVPVSGTRDWFALASLTEPSRRILIGDTNNFFLQMNILGNPPADTVLAGNVRVGTRHGSQNPYVFVDGHVQLVANSKAGFGITNPAQFFQ